MNTTNHGGSKRKYPRISRDDIATLKVIRHLRKPCHWAPIKVTIFSASCEGVGLLLSEAPPESLLIRDKVELSLRAGNASVLIPGRVVWSDRDPDNPLCVGVKFDLALARASDRKAYSSWVVANIISLRDGKA